MAALTVEIDRSDSGRLIFSQPVSLAQAIAHLWEKPPASPNALRPDPSERAAAGRQRRFLINKKEISVVLSLRHGLADQYLKRIQPIAAKGKPTLPLWVPKLVREKILGNKLPAGVHRFPGEKPFGDVVVWVSQTGCKIVQVYQDFPEDYNYYLDIAKRDQYKARLLHKVYTQFNSDMRQFVDKRRMSPEAARDEISRINEECYKMILEGMVMIMAAGAGISSISQSMHNSVTKVLDAASRKGFARGGIQASAAPLNSTPAEVAKGIVARLLAAGKKIVVNIGGEGEVSGAINLNIQRRLKTEIEHFVEADAANIGDLFTSGSVHEIVSNRLPPNILNWERIIPGAHRVLRPGGRIVIRFQGVGDDASKIIPLLERLKFKNIKNFLGAAIEAVR